MKRIAINMLIFVVSSAVYCQTGFMGKRFSINAGFDNMMAGRVYRVQTDTDRIYNNDIAWFRSNLTFSGNYVLSKRKEISAGISMIQSKYLLDSIYIFRGTTFSGDYRIYEQAKGSVAPVGKYISVGLLYHQSNYRRYDSIVNKVHCIGVSAGVGIQRVFADRIVFNVQYIAWLPVKIIYPVDPDKLPYEDTPADYIRELAKAGLVTIRFKLGLLIF